MRNEIDFTCIMKGSFLFISSVITMKGVLWFISHDPLGKVDLYSLPHQCLMESLVENLMLKWKFVNDSKDHSKGMKNIEAWKGVSLDMDDNVIQIIWWESNSFYMKNGQGTVDFRWIPCTTEKFLIKKNQIRGTLDTHYLPSRLKIFDVSENELSGSLNLTSLPPLLERFNVERNRFSENFDVSQLPVGLVYINLSCNRFSGSLRVVDLPKTMRFFDASVNLFQGDIVIGNLPEQLYKLTLTRYMEQKVVIPQGGDVCDDRVTVHVYHRRR